MILPACSSSTPPEPGAPALREVIAEAIHYWEPRRLGYNVVLAAIVLGWLALTWPHFRSALSWSSFRHGRR